MTRPITPSPAILQQLRSKAPTLGWFRDARIAEQAAQWGADQELEACCELLLQQGFDFVDDLRAARRPKPPSLKEQALEALRHAPGPDYPNPITLLTADEHALIRRALEQLDD
jgi:hypothetical protein